VKVARLYAIAIFQDLQLGRRAHFPSGVVDPPKEQPLMRRGDLDS
jgi:hypothetical protein